ncbi:uncharacterized protein DNG_02440 [Cephalotrichum gorgonifer]|uniref:Uncharacterized protein n=1 Tax=Cephalotrichum gorgonifer TaxID=2041049 RepID=A0AAE8MV16_9PEZI|nr:uncharacterized protein DNG_02440 [Cephalotrichum gorgonifer]
MAPLYDKANTALLKAWIVKRLENTSDADADVLAEYVLALLQHDGDVDSIRQLCQEEIRDFLKEEESSAFIDDVFKALAQESYLPPSARSKPVEPLGGHQPNKAPSIPTLGQYPATSPLNGSRKRSYQDRLDAETQGSSTAQPDSRRGFKQPRQGYGGADAPPDTTLTPFPMAHPGAPSLLSPSSVYPGFPTLDPATQQSFPFLPGLYPGQNMGAGGPYMRKKKPRCWEFDAKGYCSRGLTCKFDHSVDMSAIQPPQLPAGTGAEDGYDPNEPTFILHAPPPHISPPMTSSRGSNRRQRGDSRRGGRGRAKAPFSADGPVKGSKRNAIVVENIPEESFSEELVRDFFSQFGPISEVSMRPYKHLAIVKFESHQWANAAYRSPKVIFDNRFVKVFWYKEELDGATPAGTKAVSGANGFEGVPSENDTPEIDMDEFLQKQAEAQKIYEEKKERREALLKEKEELDKRQQELLARQLEAKRKLEARLGNGSTTDGAAPSSTADLLRAQLKKLEEEAMILGLDPNAPASLGHEEGWARGGYRGRGGARGRGRGAFRGGSRGGGYGSAYGDVHEAYAAYSLDNRPKRVAVTGADFTVPAKDEALRQYLLGIGEFTAVESTPSTTHIAFKDRKTAEAFFNGLNEKTIPGEEDTLVVTWVPNGTASLLPSAKAEQGSRAMDVEPRKEEKSEEAKKEAEEDEEEEEGEVKEDGEVMDYEVADEHEWGN